jgi:hypothetical protein
VDEGPEQARHDHALTGLDVSSVETLAALAALGALGFFVWRRLNPAPPDPLVDDELGVDAVSGADWAAPPSSPIAGALTRVAWWASDPIGVLLRDQAWAESQIADIS